MSRTRIRLGSSFSATGVSTGAGEVYWTNVPDASISFDPSAAMTVTCLVASCPASGSGASILTRARPTSPGSTSSDGGEKLKRTNRSGSRPDRNTRLTRWPPRLSMTASSCPTTVSRTRTTLGSSRMASGASTGAADVDWTKLAATSRSGRPCELAIRLSDLLDSWPAAGCGASTCTRARPTSPGSTSIDGGANEKCTRPSGSRPPRKTRRTRVPPRLSIVMSSRPTAESRTRSRLGSTRSTIGTAAEAVCSSVTAVSTGESTASGPAAALTVSCLVAVEPASGIGPSIRTATWTDPPGGTVTVPGEKKNRTTDSGSRPPRVTDRGSLPPLLSTVSWKRPASASLIRTTLGSARSTSGVRMPSTVRSRALSTTIPGSATDCTRTWTATRPAGTSVPAVMRRVSRALSSPLGSSRISALEEVSQAGRSPIEMRYPSTMSERL